MFASRRQGVLAVWNDLGRRFASSIGSRRLQNEIETFTVVSSSASSVCPPWIRCLSRWNSEKRYYSNTVSLMRKPTDIEKRIGEILEDQPDIQTMNAPPDMTEEEIHKLFDQAEEETRKEEEARFVRDWKPGMRRRPLVVSYNLEDLEYDEEPDREPRWISLRDKRCGLLGIKVGMMPWWDDWGERHPCTVLYVDQNVVMAHKTLAKHGYSAIQIAAGQRKGKNVSAVDMGQYQHLLQHFPSQQHPPYLVREFRITNEEWFIPLYTQLHARHFVPGQNVDISGISKGKGFQGPMKRWNFGGMPASHGTSLSHRAHGSTGQRTQPGKVWKGKKMAGHMGVERVTVQNLRIVKIDRGRNLIYVRGAVPGNKGEWVEIRDAIKKPLWKTPLVLSTEEGNNEPPHRPPLPTFAFDQQIDGCGNPGYEEIMPPAQKDPLSTEPEVA